MERGWARGIAWSFPWSLVPSGNPPVWRELSNVRVRTVIVAVALTVPLASSAGAQDLASSPDAAPTTVPPTPTPTQPSNDEAERARAYAAWQEQARAYAAWQAYQYAMWQSQSAAPKRRWYGGETLASDGVSAALVIAGVLSASGSRNSESATVVLAGAGFLGFALGPPIIHAIHGHGGKAAASLGLRVASTLLLFGGAIGCSGSSRQCRNGYEAMAYIGALGYPTSIVLDAALIAREDVQQNDQEAFTLVPWLTTTREGAAAGVMGAF